MVYLWKKKKLITYEYELKYKVFEYARAQQFIVLDNTHSGSDFPV